MADEEQIGIFKKLWRALFGYTKKRDPLYHPIPKYYLFNETGNILICTSAEQVEGFETYVKDAFTDVSVFLAAMTKALAISRLENEKQGFSIYNYQAIKEMFAYSPLFVETNAEHGFITTTKVGETLGKRFVQKVLGKSFDERSLPFTRGMFHGMRNQHQSEHSITRYQRGGHVFFICEMLKGLPTVSVVLVSIERLSGKAQLDANKAELDRQDESNEIDILDFGSIEEKNYAGSCKNRRTWRYRKRSYLFVPPNFMKNATKILNTSNVDGYDELVQDLSKSLKENVKLTE